MLIDLSEAEFVLLFLLEIEKVEVFSIGLARHDHAAFSAPPMRTALQIELIAEHLRLFQLHSIFHEAQDDWGHAIAPHSEHTEDLGNERVRVL